MKYIRLVLLPMICLAVAVLCNWCYEFQEYGTSKRTLNFIDQAVTGLEPVLQRAAGWPWCFYQSLQVKNAVPDIRWDLLRLFGNVGIWGVAILCAVLYERVRWNRAKAKAGKSNGSFKQLSLSDLLVVIVVVAILFSCYSRVKATHAAEKSLSASIKRAGGIVEETLSVPSIYGFLPENMVLSLMEPATRIVHVSIDNPSSEVLQKIVKLPRLRTLRISGSSYSLRDLEPLSDRVHLRDLRISGRELDDSTVLLLSKLKSLQALNLMRTNITAGGMAALGDMPRLRYVNLLHSDFSDPQSDQLKWMSQVQYLHLPRPARGGKSGFQLDGLEHLIELTCLEYDELINAEPVSLAVSNCPNLQTISLDTLQRFDLKLENLSSMHTLETKDERVNERVLRSSLIPSGIWIGKVSIHNVPNLTQADLYIRNMESVQITECPRLICQVEWRGKYLTSRGDQPMLFTSDVVNKFPESKPLFPSQDEIQALIKRMPECQGIKSLAFNGLDLRQIDLSPLGQCKELIRLELQDSQLQAKQLKALELLTNFAEIQVGPRIVDSTSFDPYQQFRSDNQEFPDPLKVLTLLPNIKRVDGVGKWFSRIVIEDTPNLERFLGGLWYQANRVVVKNAPNFAEEVLLSPLVSHVQIENAPNLLGFETTGPWSQKFKINPLPELIYFAAGSAAFDDNAFEIIRNSTKLRTLTLAYSSVSPERLAELGKCDQLNLMAVTGSNVNDQVIEKWSNLKDIALLYIDRTHITKQSSDWICDQRDLKSLQVDAEVLAGLSDEKLAKLEYLYFLALRGKTIPLDLMRRFSAFKRIRDLEIYDAELTPELLDSLKEASRVLLSIKFFNCTGDPAAVDAFLQSTRTQVKYCLSNTPVSERVANALVQSRRLIYPAKYFAQLNFEPTYWFADEWPVEDVRIPPSFFEGNKRNLLGNPMVFGLIQPVWFSPELQEQEKSRKSKARSNTFFPNLGIGGAQ